MNIYKFEIGTWRKNLEFSKVVLEVEEKPKTYTVKNGRFPSRINKSDIGIVTGYSHDTVYLLEDDVQKAKDLFFAEINKRISVEENKIENSKKEIERLNNYIYDLKCSSKESEE